MQLFKRHKRAEEIDMARLPRHIAIIMDGNGRWAKRRGLPRTAGHAAGAETFRQIATYCKDLGIQYLTVYAFSTENWSRPPEEVAAIMGLLEKYLFESIEKMERDGIRLRFFGDTDALSPKLRELIARTDEISDRLDAFQVNVCLNYGGRAELVRAARLYAAEVAEGRENDLDERAFGDYMYSRGIPDPELIIRPSGEYRLSNFLMWQSAYSELYFTETLWPDFKPRDIDRAVCAFQHRDRRFGGIKA